jgi:hypothetical protein
MKAITKAFVPVILSTIIIGVMEFARNEFALKSYWVSHYASLGMVFPSKPLNGALWGVWSLCFAITIYLVSHNRTLVQTTLLSWFAGFVLMWIVTGNMGVLPLEILVFAVPLSLLETFLAALAIKKTSGSHT